MRTVWFAPARRPPTGRAPARCRRVPGPMGEHLHAFTHVSSSSYDTNAVEFLVPWGNTYEQLCHMRRRIHCVPGPMWEHLRLLLLMCSHCVPGPMWEHLRAVYCMTQMHPPPHMTHIPGPMGEHLRAVSCPSILMQLSRYTN